MLSVPGGSKPGVAPFSTEERFDQRGRFRFDDDSLYYTAFNRSRVRRVEFASR
jgi:hypothetical protein